MNEPSGAPVPLTPRGALVKRPRSSLVRRWLAAAIMLAMAAFAVFAVSGTALAGAAQGEQFADRGGDHDNDHHGDDDDDDDDDDHGDLKIHRDLTSEDDKDGDSNVCVFYVVGFKFKKDQ